jgi:hypothetical protein
MNKKIFCGSVLIVGIAAAGHGFSKHMWGVRTHQVLQEKSVGIEADVVESVLYENFFKSIVTTLDPINVGARTGLDPEDMSILQAYAQQCLSEIAKVDEKAWPIIAAFKAKAEGAKRKEDMPPPPKELAGLQRERNAIALRYRERLRSKLGDPKFSRLSEFAKEFLKIEVIQSPEKPKP